MLETIGNDKNLIDYARKHSIYELSSEDILKLLYKPYLIEDIATAYNISIDEFNKIREAKGISNMILENTIRNIEVILDCLDNDIYFEKEVIKKLVDYLADGLLYGVPKKEYYVNKISKVDFSKEKVKKDIIDKSIDKEWRISDLEGLSLSVNKIIQYLLKVELDYNSIDMNNNPEYDIQNYNGCDNGYDIIVGKDTDKKTFKVEFSTEKFSAVVNKNKRKNSGSHRNQKKDNETKRLHGMLGEDIVLEAEKQRLEGIGIPKKLIDKVRIVARINEEITHDGLGYDLISYNEMHQKICIEVKTSFGKKDKPFFISKRELNLMQGLIKEHGCVDSIIYYVLVNGSDVTIKKITQNDLNKMKLTPILYQVSTKKED